MNICVAGWYFHEPLQRSIMESKYADSAFLVAHREPIKTMIRHFVSIANVGLEFGCYDWYLKNKWTAPDMSGILGKPYDVQLVGTGGSTLFLHDDNLITEAALDAIAQMTVDQAFLFSSAADAEANGKAHGRAFVCSQKFLTRLKADGGFWYDETPCDGKPIPPTTADTPDYHNSGIQVFRAYLESLPKDEFSVNVVAIVPGLKTGYRGRV